jgi:hypothetical protein
VLMETGYENYIPFIYDGKGIARWMINGRAPDLTPAGNSMPLSQLSGSCPLCTYAAPVGTTAGSLVRTLATNNISNISVNATYVNGVTGGWNENLATAQLTSKLNCQ